jgi:DNA-binding NarL/FixJ family response regulator
MEVKGVIMSINRDNEKKRLTPALYKLLEASLERKTTNSKILAEHLNRSPATIRTEFQRIFDVMGVHCRYEALQTALERGLIRSKKR